MAAYNADIQINVKGGKQLDALRNKVEELAQKITDLTYTKAEISPKLLRQSQFFVEQERKLVVARKEYNEGLKESVMLAVQFQQRMEAIARLAQQSKAQAARTLQGSRAPAGLLPAQASATPFRVAETKAARLDQAFAKLSAAAEGTTSEFIRIGNEGKQFKALPEAGKATVNYFQIAERVAKQIDGQNAKTARVNRALDKLAIAAEGSASNLVRIPQVFSPKGLLGAASAPAGLLPAAGQTGGRPMTSVSAAYENLISAQVQQTTRGTRYAEALQREALRRAGLGIGLADLPLSTAPGGRFGAPLPTPRPARPAPGAARGGRTAGQMFENLALGAGFPLLFGGGAGQVIGGFAGSFVGTGFGGQILGSAIGGIIQDFAVSAGKLGAALNPATVNIEELARALGGNTTAAGSYITELEKLGRSQEALAAATAALQDLVGVEGVDALKTFADDSTKLQIVFSQAMTQMQAGVASLINSTGILQAITAGIERNVLLRQALQSRDPGQQQLVRQREAAGGPTLFGGDPAKYFAAEEKLIQNQRVLNAEKETQYRTEAARAALAIKEQEREIAYTSKVITLEKERTAGRTTAEKLINAELDKRIALEKINYDFAAQERKLKEDAAKFTSAEGQQQLKQALDNLSALRNQAIERENIKQKTAEQGILQEKIKQGQDAITESIRRSSEAADRLKDSQLAQLDNTMTVAQARLSAEKAVNGLLLQRAEFALNNAKTDAERIRAAREIYAITVTNAKLEYDATISTLKAEVRKASIAKETLAIKLKQLEATLLQAKAEGTITKDHYASLTALKEAYALSTNQVKTVSEVARFGQIEAKAIYDSSIYAADLAYSQNTVARQTQQAASAANNFAGSMSSAAASASRTISLLGRTTGAARAGGLTPASFAGDPAKMAAASDIYSSYQRDLFFSRSTASAQSRYNEMQGSLRALQGASSGVRAFARGGYVTGPTRALIGEGSEPEYIIPESKANNFAMNYLSGARGARALNGSSGGAGPITIQTGPVIQQDGQNYVSVADLEDALQDLADMMLGNGRSAGARHYAGIN